MAAIDQLRERERSRPRVLGRYRLGERIGAGGFGVVHAALDERLDRWVAVKAIPVAGDAGAKDDERARTEALAAARLDHPAIVSVLDAGEEDGVRFLVSELVDGDPLDALFADDELSDHDVVRIGLALCEALEHAHEQGVVHRDVKPANLLVPARRLGRGRGAPVKLCDFGVAHLVDDPRTRTGDVVGTLAYMAPEQAEGRRIGPAADLYSAALVIYEGLAGRNPVRGNGPAATARRVGKPIAPLHRARSDLPRELCAAIDVALAPRPADRGSVGELADALVDGLENLTGDAGTLDGVLAPLLGRRAAPRRLLTPALRRALAAAGAAGLALLALSAVDAPPYWPWWPLAGGLAAAAVATAPRVGYLGCALAVLAWLEPQRPGLGLAVAVAAIVPPLLLLGRNGCAWTLPAAAPALGLIGIAGAFPALAGQARAWYQRAALGAAGALWAVLAEAIAREPLALGAADRPPGDWAGDPVAAYEHVLRASVEQGWALAIVWGTGAALLPWLVRGRSLVLDLVAASGWAGIVAAAGGALAGVLGPVAEPHRLVTGALACVALAVLARALAGPLAANDRA